MLNISNIKSRSAGKENILRALKMTAYYSFVGVLFQALLVNILIASSPAEGQNLRDIKLSMKAVNVSLEDAFKIVEQKTDFIFTYSKEDIPGNSNVVISVEDESLYHILEMLAIDYNLVFNRINNHIVVKKSTNKEIRIEQRIIQDNGTIIGTVKDARSKSPIPGANLLIIGLNIGAAADANGNFTIKNVPAGKYELRASAVGYGKVAKSLIVQDGKTTSIDFLLDDDAVGLDEVVVTGVAFETKRKEIPADIGILSSKAIEEKNSTNMINLIRGEVPGVFAMTNGQNDFSTFIYLRGAGMSASANEYAKILLDGIEVSAPTYLATIDPKIIERIEIIRGPHASALYGAEATSGVINLITKKGGNFGLDRPLINFSHSTGYIESEFYGKKVTPDGASPFQTNNSLQLSGGMNTISYRVGVTYNTVGEWIKNYSSKTLGFSGGMRFVHGKFTGDLTTMWSRRTYNSTSLDYQYERWPSLAPNGWKSGIIYPNVKYIFNQVTLGMNLNYQALENWNHKLTLGYDENGYDYWQPNPYRLTPTDTLQQKVKYFLNRVTMRYLTAYKQQITEDLYVRATLGAEYSRYSTNSVLSVNIKLNSAGDMLLSPAGTRQIIFQDRWTAGYNGMFEAGYGDQLFLTVSSSIKQDVTGAAETYTNDPKVGLSYVQPVGEFEIRLRGQYGSATRPVNPSYAAGSTSATTVYLPNANLLPEQRGGLDAGIDFNWGNNASLSITRFDEAGKNLIQRNLISTVGTVTTYQYINIGDIKIKGWEMQGKLNFGFMGFPFVTLKANYTVSDNVIGKNSNASIPSPTNYLLEGDRVLGTPRVAGGGNLTFAFQDWNVSFDWDFQGGIRTFDNPAWYDYRYGTAVHRDAGKTYAQFGTATTFPMVFDGKTVNVSKSIQTRSYVIEWPVYWRFGLHGEYRFSSMFSVFANITNLFNETKSEANSLFVNMGRVSEVGIRINY